MKSSNGQMISFDLLRIYRPSKQLPWNDQRVLSFLINLGSRQSHWLMNDQRHRIKLANDVHGTELLVRDPLLICSPHQVCMREVSIINLATSMILLLNLRDYRRLCLTKTSKLVHLDSFTRVSFLNLPRNSCHSISRFRMFLQW